ncbi:MULTISPECIES: 1,2-phenylacetyl-CoA epoxidase subunit PaaC [Microbacterium]|uniref:Putative phenylacetic acid degradation protein PaaC/phenylacetate-CoA oxygenase, PaaI subunit n=2 Tax=Microbacterium TaxID=33882 RepID=A0A4Y4B3R9_MICMQ|nr:MULTISPECIES: 1,2-phenylacetyl-CoA epoxidase subunit PaaC [Microbacterium]QYG11620.1 phenylacetate-CoA oxygenase subunit PaaC [Microbacterium sp. PAMC22086]GEC75138.1 putative phenylacetic acid degradation protein PaaC/phenylacetate-CoA oxygenase, PaaI subunit [Microbacterium liquefaciens]GGV53939.1 putative phenylacetic acid degradation protein PaaC/phenylacetate-CoA oxygenase, PaaI subunit [Microbacterium liquefaciens]
MSAPHPTTAHEGADVHGDIHGDIHGDVSVDEISLSQELSGTGAVAASADIAEYALRLGDDALILSQQLGAWISRAPELEEDVALGNIALDLLGHARSFLHYAGSYDGRSEDDLAFFRDEPEFRCAWIVQQPNGDFAQTIARQFVVATYMFELYSALRASSDETFAAIAEKSLKEVDYHRDHAVQWMLRLAGGTEESRTRIIRAIGDVWPYVDELFRDDDLIDRLGDAAARPSSLRPAFDRVVDTVFAEADVSVPAVMSSSAGGRDGAHATPLGHILAEMQVLARRHPGATW